MQELGKITDWDVLGIYLGFDESEITEIRHDHQSNARSRRAMFAKWMEKETIPSWERVIDALESMSQIRLANQLKEKYCTSESNPPATAAGPKPAESSLAEHTAAVLVVDRQESIIHEVENLEERYLLLVTSVHSAMAEANPSLLKLQMFSKFYTNTKVATVEGLFDQLEPFYFLDCVLLEKIVKFFLRQAHPVVDNLREYRQQLAKFKSSMTVKQFMNSIEQAHSTTSERPGLCTVKLRLVGGWLTKTMDDLEKCVKEIFKDKTYILSYLKIVRGSVIVTYSAPQPEADLLKVLLREQSSLMVNVGVYELVVGDEMVVQIESNRFLF